MLSPRKAFKLIWNTFCVPVGKFYPGWLKLADLFLLTNESSQSKLSILKVRVPSLPSLDEGAILGRVRINCLDIITIFYYSRKYFREISQHLVIKKVISVKENTCISWTATSRVSMCLSVDLSSIALTSTGNSQS